LRVKTSRTNTPWGPRTALALGTAAALLAQPALAVPEIAPHQATYKLSLASARSSSPVADVDGTMTFAWKDACDGWTIEQRFVVRFLYAEGEEMNFTTSYVTWESKDGKSYRFNVKKLVNGQVDEELKGEASLKGPKGGTARFDRPSSATVDLRAGTMFPTAHTMHLLEMPGNGEPFFARPVFDGSEAEGATPISAVVGKAKPIDADDFKAGNLVRKAAFPVHLAFFPTAEQEYLPDYETTMMLQDNGVVRSMLIDYGDFKVDVKLESLEPTAKPPC